MSLPNEWPTSHHTMRRLIVLLLACLVLNGLWRWLNKVGLGKLPGDYSFRLGGRQ